MIWQSDPLEALGGIPSLEYDESRSYPSPLLANASVSWETRMFEASGDIDTAIVDFAIAHQDVNWEFLRGIYGWAAVQYQTWVRGTLHNHAIGPVTVAIYAPGVIEMYLDTADGRSHHFGVDFYGFDRAPIIVRLKPGPNTVDVRLIRDVRANGGLMPPTIEASLRAEILQGPASIVQNSLIVPDVHRGRFVSPLASLTVVNHGKAALFVERILVNAPERGAQATSQHLCLAPGQSKPLRFRLDGIHDPGPDLVAAVSFRTAQRDRQNSPIAEIYLPFHVTQRNAEEPQRLTFLHPSGSVSYAVLLPPSPKVVSQHRGPLPVMVALHGSGLDVDSYLIRHSFDGAPDLPAWLLFPTGMSPWCGDDWHNVGMSDIDAALNAIPDWIERNRWEGPGALTSRFLLAGHSNGGHGTWHVVLRQPDRVIAAAPASGYISVENYVPQSMWDDVDPAQAAVLSSARAPFRQELFLENMKGKPVLVQHGELDDNVPAYHSRLMKSSSALHQGIELTYAEAPTKFHWWDGAMTTEPMLKFYLKHLEPPNPPAPVPDQFSFVVSDAYEFGSQHGIQIDQLLRPDALARIAVDTSASKVTKTWKLTTRNVRRFRLDRSKIGHDVRNVQVDESSASFSIPETSDSGYLVLGTNGWVYESERPPFTLAERTGKQRGRMDAILRTTHAFVIISHASEETNPIALQTSRNLLQYFGADSDILSGYDHEHAVRVAGNTISIALGQSAPKSQLESFPISVHKGDVWIREKGHSGQGRRVRNAVAAAWLQPLQHERLELVLWGKDEAGLRQASRLLPTLTGGGQPDFVIFEDDEIDGVKSKIAAMGFFDYAWEISAASYVP